ncbi:hypothetical protein NQ318_009677 [Aromia moschata]|uniref:Phospholipase A2 n=1 Tax=Aromia moschata TaxID=1265417 RepID=A0AAV8XAG7_9CUCU|nr:hypothetical protein NQ318_009677 [Aromia moschata]
MSMKIHDLKINGTFGLLKLDVTYIDYSKEIDQMIRTKWCGTGDIAKNYFDLGTESTVDACCRAHDLCPVKIRAYSKRYNLTNNSLYTKSHCKCDDRLFNCLKGSESQTANIMGNIYFNLVQVPCLEDTKIGRRFRNARNNF